MDGRPGPSKPASGRPLGAPDEAAASHRGDRFFALPVDHLLGAPRRFGGRWANQAGRADKATWRKLLMKRAFPKSGWGFGGLAVTGLSGDSSRGGEGDVVVTDN